MTQPFLLRSGVDGIIVTAELLPVDDRVVGALVASWVPILRATNEDDAKWDYPGKRAQACYPHDLEHVAVMRDGYVEAVLMTSVPKVRLPMSELPSLLYVEYIAVAPWNRAHLSIPQNFGASGRP